MDSVLLMMLIQHAYTILENYIKKATLNFGVPYCCKILTCVSFVGLWQGVTETYTEKSRFRACIRRSLFEERWRVCHFAIIPQ